MGGAIGDCVGVATLGTAFGAATGTAFGGEDGGVAGGRTGGGVPTEGAAKVGETCILGPDTVGLPPGTTGELACGEEVGAVGGLDMPVSARMRSRSNGPGTKETVSTLAGILGK